jgi:hypothetical protein
MLYQPVGSLKSKIETERRARHWYFFLKNESSACIQSHNYKTDIDIQIIRTDFRKIPSFSRSLLRVIYDMVELHQQALKI